MNVNFPDINTDYYRNRQILSFGKAHPNCTTTKTIECAEFCHVNSILVNYLKQTYPGSWFAKIDNKTAKTMVRTFFKNFFEVEDSKKLSCRTVQTVQANSEIEQGFIILYGESNFNNALKKYLEFLKAEDKKKFIFSSYIERVKSLNLVPQVTSYDILRSGCSDLQPSTSKRTVKLCTVRNEIISEILKKNDISSEVLINDEIENHINFGKLVKKFISILKESNYNKFFCQIAEKLKESPNNYNEDTCIEYAEKFALDVKEILSEINIK